MRKCRYCGKSHSGNCDCKLRWHAVDATKRFIERVSEFAWADPSSFPAPTGLGADGTCWTNAELREWIRDVAQRAAKIMEPAK